MNRIPVIAVFDIGKTNKKLFLFDEDYHIRYEKTHQLKEATDPDGFPCEDVTALEKWMHDSLNKALQLKEYQVKALNFSGYGASFVHIGANEKPVAPLYNYLKPFPPDLKEEFYQTYGGETNFCMETSSPSLGHLNSGMQLYWLKKQRPEVFNQIKFSLHLPQYLSYLFTGKPVSDITSIGCHTNLWNFATNQYHSWVIKENIASRLAPLKPSDSFELVELYETKIPIGVGLHDSSAALIPYLTFNEEPFALISTGTWSISLNPFNTTSLTAEELQQDCLCYLTFKGTKVKASRLFAGHVHDEYVKQLAEFFHKAPDYHYGLEFNPEELTLKAWTQPADYHSFEQGYYSLMEHLVKQQMISTRLVLHNSDVKRIFVDGGFSNSSIFMNLLTRSYPDKEIFSASLHQASAIGAAMSIHSAWNSKPVNKDMMSLKRFY
jgi:sugar (pentulose or hexulose) kinase